MIFQIVSLLLDIACGLFTGACLLRLYMQMQRISFANPVGQLVFVLTDWLVIPLRKFVPSAGRWDLSCLIGAFLGQLVQYLILSLFVGASAAFVLAPLMAVFGVARAAISGMMGLVIINAILSWVQSRSPITAVLERLCEPVLRPIRRVMPLLGGIDFSPLLALVVLQVLMIVLQHLQASVLSIAAG